MEMRLGGLDHRNNPVDLANVKTVHGLLAPYTHHSAASLLENIRGT